VPHHQGETAVGHHLTEIVGVTNETVHAVGNELALDAQREVLLGVGGDHEHAAHNAQTDAKAEHAQQKLVILNAKDRLAEFFRKAHELYPDSLLQTERIFVSGSNAS